MKLGKCICIGPEIYQSLVRNFCSRKLILPSPFELDRGNSQVFRVYMQIDRVLSNK